MPREAEKLGAWEVTAVAQKCKLVNATSGCSRQFRNPGIYTFQRRDPAHGQKNLPQSRVYHGNGKRPARSTQFNFRGYSHTKVMLSADSLPTCPNQRWRFHEQHALHNSISIPKAYNELHCDKLLYAHLRDDCKGFSPRSISSRTQSSGNIES